MSLSYTSVIPHNYNGDNGLVVITVFDNDTIPHDKRKEMIHSKNKLRQTIIEFGSEPFFDD